MHELYGEVPNGEAVLFYAGEPGYFMSNFSAFRVIVWGVDFDTSEHAYHYGKFDKVDIKEQIATARSAHFALKLAHQYRDQRRLDCDEVYKLRIMSEVVRAKHDQHEYIQRKLKATGDAWLIENSPTDAFWGRGPDWRGRNELGKIWMKVRAEANA